MLQPRSYLLLTGIGNNAFILLPGRVWGELLVQGVDRDLDTGCSIDLSCSCLLKLSCDHLYLKASENRVFAYKKCSHICQRL